MENAVTTAEPSSPATPRATRMEVDGSRRFLQALGLVLSLFLAACSGGGGNGGGAGTPGGTTGGDTSTSGGTTGGAIPDDMLDPNVPTLSQALKAGDGAVFAAEAADGSAAAAGLDADGALWLTLDGETAVFKIEDVAQANNGQALYLSSTGNIAVLGEAPINEAIRPDLRIIDSDYTAFGAWAEIEPSGEGPGQVMRKGAFYGGVPAPLAKLPTTGKAYYSIGASAVVTDRSGTGRLAGGRGKAEVDFGAASLDGTWFINVPTAADSDARISFAVKGASINGTSITGRATSDQGHGGTIEGSFFGAQSVYGGQAPEIAGRFDLEGSAGTVTGAFAGRGYCEGGCPGATPRPPFPGTTGG